MDERQSNNRNVRDEVRELTSKYFDDGISEDDFQYLQRLLVEHRDARQEYIRLARVHEGLVADSKRKKWGLQPLTSPVEAQDDEASEVVLREALGDTSTLKRQAGDAAPLECAAMSAKSVDDADAGLRDLSRAPSNKVTLVHSTSPKQTNWRSHQTVALFAVAASLLMAASVTLLPTVRQKLAGSRQLEESNQKVESDSGDVRTKPVIANVATPSSDCRWIFESPNVVDTPSEALESKVHAGDTLRVLKGSLRLDFEHGTTVTLAAPAILKVDSSMRSRLFRGRTRVKVAPGAEGFTVDTPRSSVVDLGTEFGVDVDDSGSTEVFVFDGEVDVAFSSDMQDSTSTFVSNQRLHTGRAMRIGQRGDISRITSLNSERFAFNDPGSQTPRSRAPLISAVDHNIKRTDAWQFYEIVPEGMGEDAKAFADRLNHEWNGVDSQGMPSYLIGGDYIKAFNSDRWIKDLEVELTLDQPAILYVLWDTRNSLPSWLLEQFEDTGDTIGVDEGDHRFPNGTRVVRGESGMGPGNSIDAVHSIWRRAVKESGKVVLVGPGISAVRGSNMYGIVATPLVQ